MEIRIGISGWLYPPWRKIFYPEDLPQKQELHYASRQVSSIEINGSFYSSQSPESYQKWFVTTPKDFVFSVKGPRYITHIRRLKDIEEPLANFFATGVLYLQEKLGAFLWQFPPNFLFDEERLENFFKLLPTTFSEAVKLSESSPRYGKRYPRPFKSIKKKLRHAIEVRHHSFENPAFIDLLRKYNIALVFADTAGTWPYMEDLTSDFVYLRLHGPEELYASGYDDATLRWWADRLKLWTEGKEPTNALSISDKPATERKRDAFVYFDNDIKVRAPFDAQSLMRMLGKKASKEDSARRPPELNL
ncbi:hypothetical protein AZI85_05285 [Bdellovibrio bacteriovorus]|uniref:DUF72 domain-containing protein n=1 Tax=Bdellovibrio bacteriovorus TaxID=959 RepID=A0A150WIK0_BDEBC|nr:DUF72 domain-containing protein [Bdellovibrio bacteriovorus]KYG63444.1 hypothetical protein AZI85_05285 [Bdellovibrio bacteriovorus]